MKRVCIVFAMMVALSFGLAVGVYSQQASLGRLAEERANVSKMDWILLNTRVYVLEQALKDDLALPVVPTSYRYDSEKQQIGIAVYVAPSWLAKTDRAQANKAFLTRATSLCVAPTLAAGLTGDLLSAVRMLDHPSPGEWCAVRFFTLGLDSKGNVEPRGVATYERGKLTME